MCPFSYIIFPATNSLSDLDHVTIDFGPGLELIKVLIISSIILLLGMEILHSLIEYLKISEMIDDKKINYLETIQDESTEDIRIVLIPKNRTFKPNVVMEDLFKNTDLEIK